MKSLTITTSTNPNEEKASWKQSTTVLPSPPQEVVADLFKEKLPTPPLEVVAAVFPSTQIVDYSDSDDEESPPGTRGRRGAVVKGIEHISIIVFVNI